MSKTDDKSRELHIIYINHMIYVSNLSWENSILLSCNRRLTAAPNIDLWPRFNLCII